MESLEVARRLLVQEDEVELEALEAEERVRDEELPGQGQLVRRADPGQDDRAIARDPEAPQVRLALTIGGDLGRGGPLGGAGEDDVGRQALELVGVLGRPAAVTVLELAVGPGQLEGPGRRVRLVILVGQGEGLLARRRPRAVVKATTADPPGPSRTRRRRLRIGSRTGPVVPESVAPGSRAAGSAGVRPRPRKRTRSVSYSTSPSNAAPAVARSTAATWTAQIGSWSADRGRRRQSRASRPGTHSVSRKSLLEGRVGQVGRAWAEDDLDEAGQLQQARPGVVVGQRDAADLGEVLRRDGHLQHGLDARVAAPEGRLVGREDDLVVVGRPADRLVAGGPGRAAPEVADIAGLAPERRAWRPRASGSRPGRGRCSSPTRRWSAGRDTASWTAGGCAARGWPAWSTAGSTAGTRPAWPVDSGPGATSDGSTIVTSRGMRSCRRRSTARTIGTAWNRRGIGSSSTALARATRLIPWWWAMYERTTAERRPWGTRSGV